MTSISDLMAESLRLLRLKGIETSRQELRLLMACALDIAPDEIYFYDKDLTENQLVKFETCSGQRAEHCPVDKIIGHRGFYKYDFEVNCHVLSPRPDTEILVEEAAKIVRQNNFTKILEFGVGSGCIILSLLADVPSLEGIGTDISEKALETARRNAQRIGVEQRIKLMLLDWFDQDILQKLGCRFDIIVSNPPYIPSGEINLLDREVKDFDPLTALDGGKDGLRDFRKISGLAGQLLKPEGYLLFEGGENQADKIADIAVGHGFNLLKKARDLNGIERCIILKK